MAMPIEAVNTPAAQNSPSDELPHPCLLLLCATVTAATAAATAVEASAVDTVHPADSARIWSQVDGMFVTVANFPERLTPSQVPPAAKSRPF